MKQNSHLFAQRRTDGGASALTGQMRTASGETLLFVIFNMSGDVERFREYQDALVTQIQCAHGGPAPFDYHAQPLTIRLAGSEIDTPQRVRDARSRPEKYGDAPSNRLAPVDFRGGQRASDQLLLGG